MTDNITPEALAMTFCDITKGATKPVIVYSDCGIESATMVPVDEYDVTNPARYLKDWAIYYNEKLPEIVLIQSKDLPAICRHETLHYKVLITKIISMSYVVKFPQEDMLTTTWVGIPESAKDKLPTGFYDYIKSLTKEGGAQ